MNPRILARILGAAFVASLSWAAFLALMLPMGVDDLLRGMLAGYEGDLSPKAVANFVGPPVFRSVTDGVILSTAPMAITCLACLSLLAAINRGWIALPEVPGPSGRDRDDAASRPGPKWDDLDDPLAKS